MRAAACAAVLRIRVEWAIAARERPDSAPDGPLLDYCGAA